MSEQKALKQLIEKWKDDYRDIKNALVEIGAKPHSLEYNLLATEALALSCCILDATDTLIEVIENERK